MSAVTDMGIGKQSKTLNKNQIEMVSTYLRSKRNGLRNQTIFLLSVKSGLRAKEIASLQWRMVVQPDGKIDDYINLPNSSSKGRSGRVIPLHSSLKVNLSELLEENHGSGPLILIQPMLSGLSGLPLRLLSQSSTCSVAGTGTLV